MHISTHHTRRAIGAAALAGCAALATLTTLALTASTSADALQPACTSSGLVVWLDTMGNGTAGSTYFDLEFTNLSGHSCVLTGYPGVSGVDLNAHQLGSAASRNAEHGAAPITLNSGTSANMAGATATAVLRITDVANFPSSTCKQVTAAGLRVYPPGQTASKLIPFPFRACSRSGPTYLSVEAIQKGIVSNG